MQIFKYISLKANDTTTKEGREKERYRLAILSMIANIFSKCITMLVMILSIKLSVPYLGEERFGIWMTVLSLSTALVFLDFGISNALVNSVSKAAVKGKVEIRRTVSGGLGFLVAIALGISSILMLLTIVLPWESLIKINDASLYDELEMSILVFGMMFGVSIFSKGVQRVFVGLQKGYWVHIYTSLLGGVSIVVVVVLTKYEMGIPELLISTFGIQASSGIFLINKLRNKELFSLRDLWSNIHEQSKRLIGAGGVFLALQIGMMVGWGMDTFLISSIVGVAYAATYSITQKLFMFLNQPLGVINAPLWASYSDAYFRGEKEFIRKTLLRSLSISLLFGLFVGGILSYFGNYIISTWSDDTIQIESSFIVIFFIWVLIEALGSSFSMFLNGCGFIKEQLFNVVLLIVLSLPLKLYMLSKYGIEEMMVSFITVYLFTHVYTYGFKYRKKILEALKK